MVLKAVLFDFNGVIINDEPIHEQILEQLLLEENVRVKSQDFRDYCLGRSDRACLINLLTRQGRITPEDYLQQLIERKALAYRQHIEALEKLPIYRGVKDIIDKVIVVELKMALVSGAVRSEIELVLEKSGLIQHFPVIVAGDDITTSKPEPDGYLLAIEQLNQIYPTLDLKPSECLVIEDTFAGIEAAKKAGIPVVGVAHTYPFHMLQRLANWCVDYLWELELDRVRQVYQAKN
ncbi:MAG: HAD family phosphatase [Microcoleaceae cyanobacterium]